LEADGLEAGPERVVRVEQRARFGAGDPHIRCAQHDAGHAIVDERRLDAVDHVHGVAGGKQRASHRAGDVLKQQRDCGSGAGNAVDRGGAGIRHATVGGRDLGGGDLAGIQHANAHRRGAADRRHQSPLDRGGTDPGEDVAAGLGVSDDRPVDEDLQEQVVGVAPRRR
jgi:hypothetical protein